MTEILLETILERLRTMPAETLIAIDPDGLVRAVPVLDRLASEGVAVIVWEDSIEARLAWECIPAGQARIVTVEGDFRADTLPADILASAGRRVTLTVRELFAPLDRIVASQLDWADRAEAFQLARTLPATPLRAEDTASLLLRHLYRLDDEVSRQAGALLEGLLRHHRSARPEPVSLVLARRLAARVGDPLPGMPTIDSVRDRARFVAWLQDSWSTLARGSDDDLRALLMSDGPRQLLDDYFDDGILAPVDAGETAVDLPFGVTADPIAEDLRRVESGLHDVADLLNGEISHAQWRTVADRWADVLVAAWSARGEDQVARIQPLRSDLNQAFVKWLPMHFPELASLPSPAVPAMVHRVPRVMDTLRQGSRAALILVDGLSLAVWKAILPILRGPDWHVTESTTFAWLPTVTSVSRQAIFAGRAPVTFSGSITTTAREPDHWAEFWAGDPKLPRHEVGYVRAHLRNDVAGPLQTFAPLASQLGRTVLGVVVEDVDHELHGERLGEAAFHASITQWAREGHLRTLIDLLLGEGYLVFLTSDHGFVPATTVGVSQAGATADRHGRFERFYDQLLADQAQAKSKLEGRMPWTNFGLPPDYLVTFAPMFGAFKPIGDRLLTHGGPTMEEVIVPWATIAR